MGLTSICQLLFTLLVRGLTKFLRQPQDLSELQGNHARVALETVQELQGALRDAPDISPKPLDSDLRFWLAAQATRISPKYGVHSAC